MANELNTMEISAILKPTQTINNVHADSKKSVLEAISKLMAQNLPDMDYEQIFDCLLNREKIGSTGIGHGVAIPHCCSKNIPKPVGVFIRLQKPIDFGAIDNQPVDLFFTVLIPEGATEKHLELLATLAEKFRHKEFREKLRQTKTDADLYKIVTGS
jgi:PTS system nitrogen regulatory IIA component